MGSFKTNRAPVGQGGNLYFLICCLPGVHRPLHISFSPISAHFNLQESMSSLQDTKEAYKIIDHEIKLLRPKIVLPDIDAVLSLVLIRSLCLISNFLPHFWSLFRSEFINYQASCVLQLIRIRAETDTFVCNPNTEKISGKRLHRLNVFTPSYRIYRKTFQNPKTILHVFTSDSLFTL